MDSSFLSVRKLCVDYGGQRILHALSLDVARGEFVALLGSSGCGKTTLLRSIAGFTQPSEGAIHVAGRDLTHQPPDRRGMALVFQSYALWPHMTVAQHLAYGLKLRGMDRKEIATRCRTLQDMLGLQGLEARKPAALSGGQRQRVALGRALAVQPDILLLDEPLSNLDARIRLSLRHDIRALQQQLGITAVHVTHDREEAMVMVDRIVVLDRGRIAQAGAPEHIYNQPANEFVAAFLGAENALELPGSIAPQGGLTLQSPLLAGATVRVDAQPGWRDGRYTCRFRAEAVSLRPYQAGAARTDAADDDIVIKGQVSQLRYPGGQWRHQVEVGPYTLHIDAAHAIPAGSTVEIAVPRDRFFVFPRSADGHAANADP